MKVAILAGGLGTRLTEETELRPKPMIEVGGRPLLWHIMKHYYSHGFHEFCLALGYKGDVVKRYFLDYHQLSGHVSVELKTGHASFNEPAAEDWTVNLVDTGVGTNTGGRLKRLKPWLAQETFMLTYGDGLSDVDLAALVSFHRECGTLATVTAVRPPARFGGVIFDGNLVAEFTEKPQIGEGWINGGFMVFEPEVLDYIQGDGSSLEADLLERLARDRQLSAYRHDQFWQCVDTLRDLRLVEGLWDSGRAPWKIWD
jgi:glucose-1-phosphate cytidylyltransferase